MFYNIRQNLNSALGVYVAAIWLAMVENSVENFLLGCLHVAGFMPTFAVAKAREGAAAMRLFLQCLSTL